MPKSQTSRPNQNQPSFIMDNLGFHKSKLYSLILAALALISLLLPWISVSAGGFGGTSKNGFGGWGLLALIGVGVVVASCFMGDRTKAYLIRVLTIGGGKYGGFVKVSPGFGLFIGLAAGVIGLLLLLGMVKVPKSIDDKVK